MRKQRFILVSTILIIILTGFAIQASEQRSANVSQLVAPVFRTYPLDQTDIPRPLKGVNVPSELFVCLGQTGTHFDISGIAKDQRNTFYLLSIYDALARNNPLDSHDELIALGDKYGCLRLIEPGMPLPLHVYLPTSVAKELELQRYRHWIEQMGGKQKFEQALSARINASGEVDGNYYLANEQVWALQRLGIKLPKTYKLLSLDSFATNIDQWRKDLLN